MGEAHRNPRSPKFKLGPEDSADPQCMAAIGVLIEPTKAWQEANPSKDGEPDVGLVPPEETEVVFYVVGQYVEPSHLTTADKWPRAIHPVLELGRMPFLAFKGIIQANNPQVPWKGAPSTQELDS